MIRVVHFTINFLIDENYINHNGNKLIHRKKSVPLQPTCSQKRDISFKILRQTWEIVWSAICFHRLIFPFAGAHYPRTVCDPELEPRTTALKNKVNAVGPTPKPGD